MSGRPSRMSRRGWEALPEVRVGSEGPPESPGRVERLSWISGKGWKALTEVRDRSGGPL